jgi:hypothetical protein
MNRSEQAAPFVLWIDGHPGLRVDLPARAITTLLT